MGKNEAFIIAVKSNEGLLYKISSVYTNTIEDRNDLIQEIIYQLWKSFDSFDQRASINTWIYRVAMNVAIYQLKVTKRKVSTISFNDQLPDFYKPDDHETEEKWQVLKHHLNNLNLLDKGIVMLYLENKNHEEIAAITGLSVSNVGTKLSRIKEKLRKQILKNNDYGIR